MFLPLLPLRSTFNCPRCCSKAVLARIPPFRRAIGIHDDNGDGAIDDDVDEDGDGDSATDDDDNGDGTKDNDDDDGDDCSGAAADDNNVDDVDDHNLPPRVGKRNDCCDETKPEEEGTVTDSVAIHTTINQITGRGGGRWQRIRRRQQRQ